MESSQGRKIPSTNRLEVAGRKFDCFLLAGIPSLPKEGVGQTAFPRKSSGRQFLSGPRRGLRLSTKELVVTESQTFGFEFSSRLQFISQASKYEAALLLFIYFPFSVGLFVSWRGARVVSVEAGVLRCL